MLQVFSVNTLKAIISDPCYNGQMFQEKKTDVGHEENPRLYGWGNHFHSDLRIRCGVAAFPQLLGPFFFVNLQMNIC